VATNGSSGNSGSTPTSAITLQRAMSDAVAGDTVCIGAGTYDISSSLSPVHSGTRNAWITYTADAGTVTILWTGGGGSPMVHMYSGSFFDGPSYIIFQGVTLNGRNQASYGFFCENSHHLKYLSDTVEYMGAGGIGSESCDYQTADHNIVYHNGYNTGWSSGISFDSNRWFDQYAGLHNVVSNNIVAGSYDASSAHTDGNGIIMDLSTGSYSASTADTPPNLIVNNVVYGNGGRCIELNVESNSWVVNNTCYDNDLDLTLGEAGGISPYSSTNSYFINNIVESWNGEYPFRIYNCSKFIYSHNLIDGGSNDGTPSTGFTTANPYFVAPPAYNPTAGGQFANTKSPASLGDGLSLQSDSPAIRAGIDPTTLAGRNTSLINDMSAYVYTDILGNSRPKDGAFTLGAYEQ
jgi:serralysin